MPIPNFEDVIVRNLAETIFSHGGEGVFVRKDPYEEAKKSRGRMRGDPTIGPQPGIGERIWGGMEGLGEVLQALLYPVDPEGMPNVAMVPTAANLNKFLKLIEAELSKDKARSIGGAFLKARYPKRAKLAKHKYSSGFFPDQGRFVPSKGEITTGIPRTPYEGVEVLGHEIQHAADYPRALRGVSALKPGDFVGAQRGGTYRSFKELGRDVGAYKKQPIEARAYRAQDTAEKAWGDFVDLLIKEGKVPASATTRDMQKLVEPKSAFSKTIERVFK